VRRSLSIAAGLLLIAAGAALTPLMDARWRRQDIYPVDAHVDVYADKTTIQFPATHTGTYAVSFVVSQTGPFKQVYCLLRAPDDYWSSVVCDKSVKFSAAWKLTDDARTVQKFRLVHTAAGITGFSDGGVKYLKRHLGSVFLENGRFYTLTLTLDGADIGLSKVNPRIRLSLDENEVDLRGWRALWAIMTAPLCAGGGIWLVLMGVFPRRKRERK